MSHSISLLRLHENQHGTCVSTLDPPCYSDYVAKQEVVPYFEKTVSLFKDLPTYSWLVAAGIKPSTTATYSLAQLQAVAKENFGETKLAFSCGF